jgi:hypothetical protein
LKYTAIFTLVLFLTLNIIRSYSRFDDREITDESYKFTFVLPSDWKKNDMKETTDKDAISYSFEKNDKKCAIMILAFKLNTVKNLEDFIYTMEKDVSLNIPGISGDYTTFDNGTFDGKSAVYKDSHFTENIFYYRTKLPDAPFNYVYMLRFITTNTDYTQDLQNQIKKISDSFLPTAK